MQFSASTSELLGALDALSRGKLTRRRELGTLIELAAGADRMPVLDDLSFLAKFVSKTYGIMTRIGQNGHGYDKLQREFAVNLRNVSDRISTLLEGGPDDIRASFEAELLATTPEALQNLLALCYDLSWYKNWRLDQ